MNKALCTAILSLALTPLAGAANLLVNNGFEDPITSDGAPFVGFWEGFSGGGASASATNMMPRSDAQALTLSITFASNTFAGAFQDVMVAAGNEYSFSGWHASPSVPLDLGLEVRIEWRNATSEVSRTTNLMPVPGAAYDSFLMNATAPAGATIARVVLAVQSFSTSPNGNGMVHFDDISFDAVPEPSSLGLLAIGALALSRRRR